MKFALAAVALAAAAVAVPAAAVVINFDDTSGFIANGYNGFNWNNFVVLNGDTYTGNPSGYGAGVVSHSNVALNAFAAPAAISVATGTFKLTSAYMTAAWNDGLTIQVDGYLGTSLVFSQLFAPSATAPTLYSFNGASIDRAVFSSYGGTHHAGYPGGGAHFNLDNLTLAAGVPEAASWAMMIAGFGLVGAAMRRRSAAVAA